MRVLTGSDCLEIWERGRWLHALDRGLLALSFSLPEIAAESLADWPLGRRNGTLLELYSRCFGSQLEAWTGCVECGEKLELALDARDFLKERGAASAMQSESPVIQIGEQAFRLPTSRDLASVVGGEESGSGALRLVERCRVSTGSPWTPSPEELNEVEEQMAAADPLAEIRIGLVCPTCSREWAEPLDVMSFLWAEIEALGKRLLWEVHMLASAYGWTEAGILSLSESRRSLYLAMLEGARADVSGKKRRDLLPEAAFG